MVITGRVEVGILNGSSSILRYLNGNCTWRINTTNVRTSPQIPLVGEGKISGYSLKCVDGGMEKLNAVIITHCKEHI